MKFKILAACLMAVSAAPAFADGFYVLGSVGQSSADIKNQYDRFLTSIPVSNLSSTADENDVAYKLQLGYQITENIAIEGGYIDLGKATYAATFTGGTANVDYKANGWNIDVLGILPVGEGFSLFAKAGAIDARVKTNATATGPGGTASGSASDTSWRFTWGLGASYAVTKNIGVRVEFERFQKLGNDTTTGKSDVDLISAGVAYKF